MTDKKIKPHDALARKIFSEPEHAAACLERLLPAPVARSLDWNTLERAPGSYVTEGLRSAYTDMLFLVKTKNGGRPRLIYLLFEHQSRLRRKMILRVFWYLARISQAWHEANPNEEVSPLFLPIVLYNGAKPADVPTRMTDLSHLEPEDAPLLEMAPEVRMTVVDLSRIPDATLRGVDSIDAALALLLLKHVHERRLFDRMLLWHDLIRRFAGRAVQSNLDAMFFYAIETQPDSPPKDLMNLLEDVVYESDSTIVSYGDKLRAEGHQEGHAEGHQQGHAEGRRQAREETLRQSVRLVTEARFGAIPDALDQTIDTLNSDELQRILSLIARADDLDALANEFRR